LYYFLNLKYVKFIIFIPYNYSRNLLLYKLALKKQNKKCHVSGEEDKEEFQVVKRYNVVWK